jgi:hypothetical protein
MNKTIKIGAIVLVTIMVIVGAYWVYTTFISKDGNENRLRNIYLPHASAGNF